MLASGLLLGLLLAQGVPAGKPAPGVAATPLESLGGKGQLYFGVSQQEVEEQWRQRLQRLGLAATITWAGCVSGGTPDGHAFYLFVAPARDMRDRHKGIPIRVTLHWQEAGYAADGWRLLQQLDRKAAAKVGK